MKRFLTIVLFITLMVTASMSTKAQDVTITLYPGWNWISYPKAEVLDINTVLGDFVPVDGDKIKSQFSTSAYFNGYWRGGVTHFMPGWGYMYYSNRTEVVSFVFGENAPQLAVTTSEPTDITAVSAVVGGTVTLPESSHVFLLGVCWGTESSPNIDGDHTSEETGIGSFSSTIDSLSPNTTYYVRAYIVSDGGLSYGDEVSFTTLDDDGNNVPEGAINGLFSINANGDQVYFSQGNLQYIGSASNPYWKFAENQWDYIGDNQGVGIDLDRDLFSWGTSGYNHGANHYYPWSTGYGDDYYAYGSYQYNLYDQTGQADWGYNPIVNGGNCENMWRTLRIEEWNYVLFLRNTQSSIRFAKAQVNGINGVVILPDNWEESFFTLNNTNDAETAAYDNNVITDWNPLQLHGAVFLPAAGDRDGEEVVYVNVNGHYWSSTYETSEGARRLAFSSNNLETGMDFRYHAFSVRLVQDKD